MNPERTLGKKELFALAVGTVIGAGVITLIGTAVGITGRSAWLAFELAILLGFFYTIPYLIASSMIRLKGGIYSLVGTVVGKRALGMFSAAYLTRMLQLGLFGLGLGVYINSIIPAIPPKVAGIFFVVLVYVINLMDIKAVAMFQKVITWILLGCLAMIIVVGIFNLNYNPFDFSDPEFFTNGFTGVADAAVVLVFSTQGYYLIINYSGRAKDPRKDIPWVWKYIPWLLVIVYGGVGMVAGCVLPLEECANQPLTYVVQSFLPTPLVYLFVIGGACFALLSTLNGLYSSYGAVWAEAAKDGWYPKFLSTVNKNGQPVVLMTIAAVIAVLPMLLDFSIQTITNNIILLTLFVDIFPCIAAFILPSKYPDAWKNSVVHMKKGAFICLMSVSLIVQIACAYWSARSMSITAVIISLACVAVCFIYGYFRGSKEEVKCPELSKEFLES